MSAIPVFPKSPAPLSVELFAGGDWRDVTHHVYQRSGAGVSITHGAPNESSGASPSSCGMILNNRSGNYDPANPVGPYYGTITRNTPLRVSLVAEVDTFARTVTNGWGTNDSGDFYGITQTGAGNSAASFAVSGGFGTHRVASTGSYCVALTGQTFGDVDVAVTVSVLPSIVVTGAQIEPANIMLRAQGVSQYYMVRCAIQSTGAVTMQLVDFNATPVSGLVTSANVTHVGNNQLRVRAQVEGQTLRAKVWDAALAEPAGWDVVGNYMDAVLALGAQQWDAPGSVGVRSGVASGNTNANPITFSYSNLRVRIPRYAGYVASMVPTASEISGQDKIATVTGGSILRQLNQGSQPVQSTLRHDIPTLPNLVAYWPCEDGSSATSIASAVPGGTAMAIQGSPEFASDSTFVGSMALPNVNSAYWFGTVQPYTATNAVQIRCLIKFPPAATLVSGVVLFRFFTHGSIQRWDVYYVAAGFLGVSCADASGTIIHDTGPVSFGLDGAACRLSVSVTQSGGNLTCQVSNLPQGASVGGYFNYTLTGQTITSCYAVSIGPSGFTLTNVVLGHVTVESAATDIFALATQLNAFTDEYAHARIARLCGYFGIEGNNYIGDPSAQSLQMGPQPVDTLSNLINSTVATDGGLLYDAKGSPALVYRTTGAHLSAPTVAALNRTLHQLSAPPEVTYDDSNLRNDITASRVNGSTIEVQQTTGPLAISVPPNGAGSYPQTISVNTNTDTALADTAGWALHLGTVPTPRYPQLSVNLAQAEITAALYWQLLALAPDTMITLAGQQADTITQLVRGYTEQVGGYTHTLTLNCAPGDPYLCATVDDSISRTDSDTTTIHTAMNTTTGSMVVDIADGTLWTTVSADWPFDVIAAGERMTVTAVSGTSSPQILTVTRSINAVVKPHLINEQVTLFAPDYIGLGGM